MVNAMEWLYSQEKYNTREKREGVRFLGIGGMIKILSIKSVELEGHLDLREFTNLTELYCPNNKLTSLDVSQNVNLTNIECFNNKLTSLDVSNCPKLTDLLIDAELFHPENKIIGLEKTSIIRIRLNCQEGDSLIKSQDPKFIRDVFIRKYNTAFPEMKLLDISDLSELAGQLNETTKKDKEFLKKIGNEEFVEQFKGDYHWILDQLANSILARCLIVQNRLYADKNPEYEKHLTKLAYQNLKCQSMNPKHPEASLYSTREKLVNQALNGDKEQLSKLQDLPFLNPEYKLENMLKIQELQNQIKELQSKIQATEQELTNTKNQLSTQAKTNQEQIKQLQSKIKLLEQQKENYQTKYDKSIEFIKEIREDIAKM